MKVFIAILIGILIAILSNLILDYLPYTRIFLKRKTRTFHIRGGVHYEPTILSFPKLNSLTLFNSLAFPFCPHCLERKTWKQYLLPVACQHCKKVDIRYRILLVLFPILFAWITLFPIPGFRNTDIDLLLMFYIIVFIMDVEHRVILYPVTIFGILFGLYFGFSYHTWINTLLGGLAGGGIMLVFYLFGELYVRHIRNSGNPNMDEAALGFGDVSLSLILGFILGWPGILGGLFFGIIIGGVISGGLMLFKLLTKKYAPNDIILPYAPFLIVGALVIMIL